MSSKHWTKKYIYHHKIIKETCGIVACFHVSAYFTVHRPYFRMFPLDVNISFCPVKVPSSYQGKDD